jgi:hypothetical protein
MNKDELKAILADVRSRTAAPDPTDGLARVIEDLVDRLPDPAPAPAPASPPVNGGPA